MNQSQSDVPSSKYYKVDIHSRHITALNLMFRDGGFLSLPYALNPVIDYSPKDGIGIKLEDKSVRITGRKLDSLAEWLCTRKVIWIKESKTGRGMEIDDIFIENIIVTEKS